jgi:hypothetical protein
MVKYEIGSRQLIDDGIISFVMEFIPKPDKCLLVGLRYDLSPPNNLLSFPLRVASPSAIIPPAIQAEQPQRADGEEGEGQHPSG